MTKRENVLFILNDDQGAWAVHRALCRAGINACRTDVHPPVGT